jgi:ATP-dependent helicase STH1/SNF2
MNNNQQGNGVNIPMTSNGQKEQKVSADVQKLLKLISASEKTGNFLLKKESLKKIYTALETMKKNGENAENSPSFKILADVLKRQLAALSAMKQRQQQQQQQQQQQLQTSSVIQQTQQQQQQQQQQQLQLSTLATLQQSTLQHLFTQEQKDRLKAQIYVLKFHLTKRETPPLLLLQAASGINTAVNLKQYELMYLNQAARQQQQTTQQQQSIPIQQQQQQSQRDSNVLARQQQQQMQQLQSQVQTQTPSNYPHAANQQIFSTQNIVSISQYVTKPNQMDLAFLYSEREKRIQYKLRMKHQEYKDIITSPNTSQYEKIQATIGMKQLELLQVQKALRREILEENKALEQNRINKANRLQKTKRQLEKEKKQTDRKKRKTEQEEQNKKVQERRKFLNDIIGQKKFIKEFYTGLRKIRSKVNDSVKAEFDKRVRRQKEREKREKKARLEMLKGNDIEAYKRMIKDTKNDRLNELISQTDEVLRSIGAQLITERGKSKANEDEEEALANVSAEQRILDSSGSYYKVAHRLTEIIDKQPSLLKGGELKEYQLQGLQWMVSLYNNRLNGILADEMGLGKTIQTIALLCYLYEYKNNKGPHLIIAPLSTIDNWKIEFQKWSPDLKIVVYGGTPTERKRIQQEYFKKKNFNVVLTQYEFISRKGDMKYLKKIDWNYIIIDEGHRIKNSQCKLVVNLHQYKSKHRILLTGTPLQNELKELWALLNFLLPNVFDSHVNFENWFQTGLADKVDVDNEEMYIIINRLHQVLRPFLLRREKVDVLSQLPEKVEKIVCCDISDLQRKYYQQIKQKRIIINDGTTGRRNMQNLNNPMMQLRKVCNHPFIFMDDWTKNFNEKDLIRASGKFELLDRMLPKLLRANHKCLIFSQMTQVLDLLEVYFRYKDYKFMRLDGDVKSEERGKLVNAFNHPDSDVYLFILSTRAGGLGLNLQAADTVIIFDSDWNPQQDLQAMARAHRIGQKNPVRVFTLVTATMFEQEVLSRAHQKRSTEAKIIAAGKFNQNATDIDRQEFLQKLLATEEGDKKYDIPSDEALNEMMARSDEEFELFQKIDEERRLMEENYWKSLNKPVPPRLMTESEFPDWLAKSDEIIQEATRDTISDYGRGQRSRGSKVSYAVDDLNSDDEFLETSSETENDIDIEDDEDSRHNRKKKNISGSKVKKQDVERLSDDEDNIIFVSDLQKTLYLIYKRLITLRSDEDGHLVAELFMELPDKRQYADYYQLIKNPICLHHIRQRILSNTYPDIKAMQDDVQLMVSNAQTYNQEGSIVYNDSIGLMKEFLNSVKELQDGYQVQNDAPAQEELPSYQQEMISFEEQDMLFDNNDMEQPPFF